MSMEDVLQKLNAMSDKVDALTADMNKLKDKEKAIEEPPPHRGSRSRSRSPLHTRTRRHHSHDGAAARAAGTPLSLDRTSERSWGERDPTETPDFSTTPHFSDEEDGLDLVEVSEETHRFLKTVCIRSMSNELRRRTRSAFRFPKVAATRTPKVDQVIKSLVPQSIKTTDKELSRLQTFVLDSMAPLAALMEQVSHHSDEVSIEDVKAATLTATELIGNASAHISRLRREKLVSSINKSLLPLAQEDGAFLEVAPNLFGPDFSKRAKDHLDQVKSLKAATLPARHNIPQGTNRQGPVFRRGLPSGRGLAKGRGGGPTPFNQKHHSGERNPRQN